MTDISPNGQRALEYARLGIHVFPIMAGAKDCPLIEAWQMTASADEAQIIAWWTKWPDANIGAVPDMSGHFVADLDVKKDKDGIAALRALEPADDPTPDTLAVRTPSGGLHLWFKGQVPSSAGKDGIDFRGGAEHALSRGYVLLPPSTVDGGRYEFA